MAWRRVGDRPLVDPDPRWYRTLDQDARCSETWRDPFVSRDQDGDGWHMLMSARVPGGPADAAGVLGYTRSADLRRSCASATATGRSSASATARRKASTRSRSSTRSGCGSTTTATG
jgi:hypothetical protein